ncbi:hypothetical protein ACFLWZ_07870 [Chloroflexota bacterium]
MKRIKWGCDTCGKEADGPTPPFGWVEASFFDSKTDKYRRFCFCSYRCLSLWSQDKTKYYEEAKHARAR